MARMFAPGGKHGEPVAEGGLKVQVPPSAPEPLALRIPNTPHLRYGLYSSLYLSAEEVREIVKFAEEQGIVPGWGGARWMTAGEVRQREDFPHVAVDYSGRLLTGASSPPVVEAARRLIERHEADEVALAEARRLVAEYDAQMERLRAAFEEAH